MFAGHLGVALIAKRIEPRVPLWLLIGASFGLDLLWPILLLTGLESVSIDPGNTAFTPLSFDSYPWSHSLVMTVLFGTLAGFLVRRHTGIPAVGTMVRVVFISHWFQDFLTHRADLPLWPHGPKYGLGLWHSIPGTLLIEGAFFLFAVWYYTRSFPPRDRLGSSGFGALVGLVLIIWAAGPFSPPPPGQAAVAWVTLALWVFPLWAWRIELHRYSKPVTPG